MVEDFIVNDSTINAFKGIERLSGTNLDPFDVCHNRTCFPFSI